MSRTFPQKVRVGAIDYAIREDVTLPTDRECIGEISFANAEIRLYPLLAEDRKAAVFVHELTHSIFYEAGLNTADEDTVNRVANVLHQVLRDNDFGGLRK